jgi:putative tricarboxylic transport membrane protein
MDTLAALAEGFDIAFSTTNLFYCFFGVFLGTAIGVLPGIGALAAVAMLLPVTFYLEPTTALIMLAGVYYGAEYGGSTASILLNLPGTPSNAVACLDGYPMAKQGRAGVALFITTIASFIGGTLGVLVLILLTPLVVAMALAFGPAEYFAVILFGLIAAGTVAQGSPLKGIAMVVFGIMLGSVGTDLNTGAIRYELGFYELHDGFTIVVLAMGLFGIAEVISSANTPMREGFKTKITLRSMIPSRDDVRRSVFPMLRGSGVGMIFGPLPGTGPSLAAFMAYAVEKRVSRRPEKFGSGAVEGLAAPEASNNAAVQTAFIPTLSMGIPATATMAIMLGALMIHGIQPGPRLVTQHAELFWGVVASFWIGNVLLLVLNIPLIGLWVSILKVPYRFLYPGVICLVCIGVYSINNNVFDVWLVLMFGFLGYVLRLLDFEPAPLLIGFILGPLLEENLRRALLIFRGDYLMFFQRPISGTLLALAILLLVFLVWSRWRPRRRSGVAVAE